MEDMAVYYYDDRSFDNVESLMRAVVSDIEVHIEDRDIDRYLRENGGVVVDGIELNSCQALKRVDYHHYRNVRHRFAEFVASEVRDAVVAGMFPIQVPFTYGVIESLE